MKETNSKILKNYGGTGYRFPLITPYYSIQITEILPDFIVDVDTNN